MIQAVVFDMDGTLIDSEPFWARAEQEVFGALGVPITEELAATTAGMTTAAVTQFWYKQSPWEGPSLGEVEQNVLDRVAALIRSEGEPMPGVPIVLQRMQAQGLKLALATNASKYCPICKRSSTSSPWYWNVCKSDSTLMHWFR